MAQDVKEMTVALVGNPNCGKTTLFNALTGSTLKTANWPGVTVEGKEGVFRFEDVTVHVEDLPGTYALTAYTNEEEVARTYVLSERADVIIDVVDASSLERSLYLTLELLALKVPVVVALNMMDVVKKRGMDIDIHRLSEVLGCPVIPISARKRDGIKPLIHAAYHHIGAKHDPYLHEHEPSKLSPELAAKHKENVMVYSPELESAIDEVQHAFEIKYPKALRARWHAVKLMEGDAASTKDFPLDAPELSREWEEEFISERYDFISEVMHECVFNKTLRARSTDKIDAILTNKYLSIPIFLCIMALTFAVTFVFGDIAKVALEDLFNAFNAWISASALSIGIPSFIVSLLCDGIIAGVGSVLTFLPNIAILFCALAILEDSGYMTRVAYVMDGIMGSLGLSGRAFIPLILGFGCTVPAILALHTLESQEDRKKLMLVVPFMSCSARFPIYVLFSGMFFASIAPLVAFLMYLIGIVVALVVLLIINFTTSKNSSTGMLLIELPEYKIPDAHSVWIYVWTKLKDYISRAGTVILIASVIMWVLMNCGTSGFVADDVESSFAAMFGRLIAPILAPIGCGDWRLAVALLAGISAKEVVVSSVSVLFGASGSVPALYAALSSIGFGAVNAFSFMVFCLLYVPCIATIATIAKECKSKSYAAFACAFQLVVAWITAFICFTVGSLI